jgi:hypothetical protein
MATGHVHNAALALSLRALSGGRKGKCLFGNLPPVAAAGLHLMAKNRITPQNHRKQNKQWKTQWQKDGEAINPSPC